MTEKELKRKLKELSFIAPDKEYARRSRFIILSSKERVLLQPKLREGIFSRSMQIVFSTALVAIFFFVLALGNTAGPLKTLFLPSLQGVGNENLSAEADVIVNDIDIKLSEIEYFDKSAVALAEGHFATSEEEIDKLLTDIIDY